MVSYLALMPKRTFAKGFLASSLAVGISRILGFFREILIASLFGASYLTDAFFLAWKIPNLFRRVLGEGALEKVLLPMLGKEIDKKFVENLLFFLTVSSLSLALLISFLSEWIVKFLTGTQNEDFLENAETFLGIMAFYLPFAVINAFYSSLLQYKKAFFVSYFSSAVFNLTVILFTLFFYPLWGISSLVCGVILGGLLQVAFILPFAEREAVFFIPKVGFHPKLKKFLVNIVPSFFSAGVGQISTLAEAFFATLSGGGVLSHLNYAFRLFQLPISLIGVTSSRVSLSYLSGKSYSPDLRHLEFSLKKYLIKGGEIALFFAIPTMIGIVFYSKEAVSLVYERGEFSPSDTSEVSLYLSLYSVGLIPSILYGLVSNIFYSKGKFYLSFFLSLLWVLVEITIPAVGIAIFNLGGWVIALAHSVGAWIVFFTLCGVSRSCGIFIRPLLRLKRFIPIWALTAFFLALTEEVTDKLLTSAVILFTALVYLFLFKRFYL
ncbi:MAG TPA: murein biosynthesis integral membrane protein MurJ [Aquificales bacterium]|nr:murein biosynthesis integral membrane protein MurJ [Aquificales bacterium]